MSSETGSQVSLEPPDTPPETTPEGSEQPEEPTGIDRREHERIPCVVPIKITAEGLNLNGNEQAIDLSLGGLFYQIDLPPKVGTVMEVELGVDENGDPIRAKGKVVRTVPKLRELSVPPGAGIQFTELDERGRRFIETALGRYNELHPRGQISLPGAEAEAAPEPEPKSPSPAAPAPVNLRGTARSKLLETLPDDELIDLCLDTSKSTKSLRFRARDLLERRGIDGP